MRRNDLNAHYSSAHTSGPSFGPNNGSASSKRIEIGLLLCCARTRVDSTNAAQIRDLSRRQIDWSYLIRTAFSHGVMPLLYKNLNAVCPEALPIAAGLAIRGLFDAHVKRNLLLTGELLRLLRLFSQNGIPVLPYKGPVLAATVYGDISLRSFSDLDLLVDKSDIRRAKDLILSQGYRLRKPLTEGQEAARLRSRNDKDFAFIDSRDVVKVELHWQIASLALFPLETKRLWDRLEYLNMGGTRILNLPPEDLLLTLCVHGAKHFFKRLEWVCDIAELLRAHPALDWERVIAHATRLRTTRMLFLGLLVVRNLLGVRLPPEVSKNIQADTKAVLLAKRVSDSLLAETDPNSEAIRRHAHRIGLRESVWDRIPLGLYYCADYWRALVKPNDEDRKRISLPGFLSFLYFLVRPIRLLRVYGVDLLASIRRQGRS